jgi:hypothetical protein
MDGRRARKLLGVGTDAGPDEIRRAFRARALVTHPDHGGNASAFNDVRVALETLAAVAPRPVRHSALPTAPLTHVDVYDSPRRPAPRREFADVLRAATQRLR